MKKKIARCPRCCPDGGACLKATWNDEDEKVWECQNCFYQTPRRNVTPTGKPTPSQEKVISYLYDAFGGGDKEISMIGRDVWIKITNNERPFYSGRMVFGKIGPRGSYKITLPRILSDEVVITDRIGIRVYLQR